MMIVLEETSSWATSRGWIEGSNFSDSVVISIALFRASSEKEYPGQTKIYSTQTEYQISNLGNFSTELMK